MKRFVSLFLVVLCGCSVLKSTTYDTTTGAVTTKATCWTFFDSSSGLTKFYNRASTVHSNEWAAGTSIGTLDQHSTSTNLDQLISVIVSAAITGAIKGMKP
jgi:hypothetical protein